MPVLIKLKSALSEFSALQGLRAVRFDEWNREADEALRHLPEPEMLPHELFRGLMSLRDGAQKSIVIVKEGDEPVAVVGLKQRWGRWEPVTQWIVPGALFPVRDGYLSRVLAMLGTKVKVGWWRWTIPPPADVWIKNVVPTATHGMKCSDEFEQYWRNSSLLKNIRNYRRRCEGFTFKVNSPGTREWTLQNWEARWRTEGDAMTPGFPDRMFAAEFFAARGLYHSLALFDGEQQIAGATLLAHGRSVVGQVNYRDTRYDTSGVTTRVLEWAFFWARDMGFEDIDLGGSFDYKERWAPAYGMKYEFDVSPRLVALKEKVTGIGKTRRQSS